MTLQSLLKNAPVTTLLLISFVGLYLIQLLSGVDANNPSSQALIKWGANALPFTMVDEPWRLLSSAFLHIGLMHLIFNTFAMYFFGQVAEPMFGHAKFLVIFLLSAIGGNLLNNYVTWYSLINEGSQPGLSAGASGGIMGIGGALLVAALFKVAIGGIRLNLRSLVFVMGINLIYGFAVPGIDNAGHIGGAITGALLALPIALAYRSRGLTVPSPAPYSPAAVSANDRSVTGHHSNSGMWPLLPWLVIAAVAVAFYFCWLDIYQQIALHLKQLEA